MSERTIRGIAALTFGFALGAGSLAAQQDFTWSGAVERGDAVTLRGVSGDIVARAGGGDRVRVTAVKTSREDDVSTVEVEVIEDDRGVLICAVYPSRDGRRPNRCARGEDYHMDNHRNDVRVDFTLEVPDGVALDAITVNGDVEARGLTSRVEAVTVNGDVALETGGSASATTVNGGIEARVGRLDGRLKFTTVNGSVHLTLPRDTGAEVEMSTVNGSIETDFPITIRGRWGPRSARGEIGGGGATVEVTTVNGSIHLVRGG